MMKSRQLIPNKGENIRSCFIWEGISSGLLISQWAGVNTLKIVEGLVPNILVNRRVQFTQLQGVFGG